jgi:hypothetical protein
MVAGLLVIGVILVKRIYLQPVSDSTLGAAPSSSGHLGYKYFNPTLTAIGLTSPGVSAIESVSLTAGTYLLLGQVSIGNSGGGTTTSYRVYINYGSGTTYSTTTSATGTVASTGADGTFVNFITIVNVSAIVSPTTTTTYTLCGSLTFSGNGQIQSQNYSFSYVRIA